jgi:hypothetical protein
MDEDGFFQWRDDPADKRKDTKPWTPEEARKWASKGGQATGKTKRRGTRLHYQALYALRKTPSKGGLEHLRKYWYRKRLEKVAKIHAYRPLDVD